MYQRTVHCSYCYGEGHNRTKCKKRIAYIEEKRKEDPDCWVVREFDDKKLRSKVRKCKYCREEGHNRKSCESLKKDIKDSLSECRQWRSDALRAMEEMGLGIGALIGVRGSVGLVIDFAWEQCSHASIKEGAWGSQADKELPPRLRRVRIPRMIKVKMNNSDIYAYYHEFPNHPELSPHSPVKLLSGSPKSFAESVPRGWVDQEPPFDIMNYFNPKTWRS